MEKHEIITVGRQFGSGGKSVAEALGSKLGIPVYDNELITKAAEQSGLSPELFKGTDEKRRFLNIGHLFSLNRYSGTTQSSIADAELYRYQSEAILKLAGEGSAVFVGRASDYVLRDMETLDVFVCAPTKNRIKRVSQRLGISAEEALKTIEKKDKERENFYNFLTFRHWGVASNYDLCVDSSILGVEGTADFIISFAREAGIL